MGGAISTLDLGMFWSHIGFTAWSHIFPIFETSVHSSGASSSSKSDPEKRSAEHSANSWFVTTSFEMESLQDVWNSKTHVPLLTSEYKSAKHNN